MTAEEAITTRRAIRRFLPTPVSQATVMELLNLAAYAPSGTNTQPWRVHVLTGAVKDRLCQAVVEQFDAGTELPPREYQYSPDTLFEPYLGRRRKVGFALYGLLGIPKGDKEAMHSQHRRNYLFFDAPVGMICTIDRRLKTGSWLDCGMFLQTLAVAARARGLDTCMQAAFAPYHATIRDMINLPEEEIVICGMALGHADPDAIENTLLPERVPAAEFATFSGFT